MISGIRDCFNAHEGGGAIGTILKLLILEDQLGLNEYSRMNYVEIVYMSWLQKYFHDTAQLVYAHFIKNALHMEDHILWCI